MMTKIEPLALILFYNKLVEIILHAVEISQIL